MFYGYRENVDSIGTSIAGDGVTCFRSVNMICRWPIFLAEVPIQDEKSRLTFCEPHLFMDIDQLQSVMLQTQQTLAEMNVCLVYPGWMAEKKSKGWLFGNLESVWKAMWSSDGNKQAVMRIKFHEGGHVDWQKQFGECPDNLDWVKIC